MQGLILYILAKDFRLHYSSRCFSNTTVLNSNENVAICSQVLGRCLILLAHFKINDFIFVKPDERKQMFEIIRLR